MSTLFGHQYKICNHLIPNMWVFLSKTWHVYLWHLHFDNKGANPLLGDTCFAENILVFSSQLTLFFFLLLLRLSSVEVAAPSLGFTCTAHFYGSLEAAKVKLHALPVGPLLSHSTAGKHHNISYLSGSWGAVLWGLQGQLLWLRIRERSSSSWEWWWGRRRWRARILTFPSQWSCLVSHPPWWRRLSFWAHMASLRSSSFSSSGSSQVWFPGLHSSFSASSSSLFLHVSVLARLLHMRIFPVVFCRFKKWSVGISSWWIGILCADRVPLFWNAGGIHFVLNFNRDCDVFEENGIGSSMSDSSVFV